MTMPFAERAMSSDLRSLVRYEGGGCHALAAKWAQGSMEYTSTQHTDPCYQPFATAISNLLVAGAVTVALRFQSWCDARHFRWPGRRRSRTFEWTNQGSICLDC